MNTPSRPDPSRPDNWEELTADYVLGNLSPEEAEAFKALVAAHPHLSTQVEQLQEVLALMPYSLPTQGPPPHLRTAILEAAQTLDQVPPPSRYWGDRRRWGVIGGAIAALLVAALGVDNIRLRQQLQQTQAVQRTLQQPDNLVYTIQGVKPAVGAGTKPQAAGMVVVDDRHHTVLVVAQNMPTLPPGQAYRLWGISHSGQVIYYGQFQPNHRGATTATLTIPSQPEPFQVPEVRITQESASAPPFPAGPLVMHGIL